MRVLMLMAALSLFACAPALSCEEQGMVTDTSIAKGDYVYGFNPSTSKFEFHWDWSKEREVTTCRERQ